MVGGPLPRCKHCGQRDQPQRHRVARGERGTDRHLARVLRQTTAYSLPARPGAVPGTRIAPHSQTSQWKARLKEPGFQAALAG